MALNKIKELKLTAKINGKGDILYVVTKNDTDNYQGLWLANDSNDLKKQLLLFMCDITDFNELNYVSNELDYEYQFNEIGILINYVP